jgi:hypothetical protein
MLKNREKDINEEKTDNNDNFNDFYKLRPKKPIPKKPIIAPDIPIIIIVPEKPISVIDPKIPIIPKRKRMIPHIQKDGTIEEHEIEIPDDQEDMPIVSPEEYQNNQPIIRREFVSVLNKTFNDINESITKINELGTKIKSLENIIIEHNELLKKIVNIISK